MFFKLVFSAVALSVALGATSASADDLRWKGAESGGIAISKKAKRSNGLKVRFADQFRNAPATKASSAAPRFGSTNHAKYGKIAPSESQRFGTTAHVSKKSAPATAQTGKSAKRVQFDSSKNKVRKIAKVGNSRPVNAGKPKARVVKQGMTAKQARALNAQKKAQSPKYKAYKQNQHKLAKKSSGGLRVKQGKVVPPKNARFGTTKHATAHASKGGPKVRSGKVVPPKNARFGSTAHLKYTQKGVKNTRKTAKTAKTLKKGAKIAKTGKRLRTVGKIATGGAATMVVGAALGVKVPDAVDAAMFAGKLVTDPKNAPKRLYGAAKGGVKMIGTAATTITDPGRMARNLHGAAKGVGKSISNTKVYNDLAKTKTGRTIGKATNWTKKKAGAGYNKFKKTKTAKAIGKAAKAVDKQVFKRANKGVKAIGKGTAKASKKIAKGAKKSAKKIGKGAKKVAKKLKFW